VTARDLRRTVDPMIVVLVMTLGATIVLSALAYVFGMIVGQMGSGRRRPPKPEARPIEEIGADLRRLGSRFHGLDPHASFAKVEAVRGAYDRALAECCTALGITQLLGVLTAGPELDAERTRVEGQLAGCGVRLPHAA
jgi:hypothetical protein